MPTGEDGFARAIAMAVNGVVVSAIGSVLVGSGIVPQWVFSVTAVVSIIGVVLTIDASRYWPFAYLSGFVIGMGVILPALNDTPFIGPGDWLLYGGAAVGAVALRVWIHW
ncbi:hypothetical protein [Halosegnis marinus]|uniref:SPW repeat-containing protein n=1 Tax=Halosegnis marinus TaxID=3034023 RepID=A0ABD5ZSL9_9EURY|nr:hypothetical protein [Halosegnis sp. DT85]